MVAEGWAWQYVQYDKSAELRTAQEQAKKMKLGLWADKDPTPPWEFRRSNPKKKFVFPILLLILLSALHVADAAAAKPNILTFYADDK